MGQKMGSGGGFEYRITDRDRWMRGRDSKRMAVSNLWRMRHAGAFYATRQIITCDRERCETVKAYEVDGGSISI